MPWDAATGAVDGVEDVGGEDEALGAHDGGDCGDAAFQGHMHLRFVLVLGGNRDGEHVLG